MLLGRQNFKNRCFHSFDIDNNLDSIPLLIKSFETFAQNCEVPLRLVPKINAVLTELISNIILYAFESKTKEQISTTFEILETGRFILKIKYKGLDFNPFHIVPFNKNIPFEERIVGGLGVHLVERLMDDYNYQRNGEWNLVQMTKNQI